MTLVRFICAKDAIMCRGRNAYRLAYRRGLFSRRLNIIERIITKHRLFTDTPIQDGLWVCDLRSCNILSGTNKFCLGAILILSLVLELNKISSTGLKPSSVLGEVAVVHVISFSGHAALVNLPFFCCAYFQRHRYHLHWESNVG